MTPITLPQVVRASAPPRAERPAPRQRLIDSHGRTIRDLRIGVTDRCGFRCVYCMEPSARFAPAHELLSVDEIARIAGVAHALGVRKIRLTGGEPTMRRDLPAIIEAVASAGSVDLAMTTNGATLTPALARHWRDCGLDRLTISIDAVEPDAFARMTRSGVSVNRVLAGIDAALASGLHPIKLNAVLIRGWNEDQAVPLAALVHRLGVEMRFIEFMPLDGGRRWSVDSVVPADEVIARIDEVLPLIAEPRDEPSATAETYRFADGSPGRIGVIAPVTRPFCGACSRLRVTADGKVRPCLFSTDEWDLRPLLRGGADDESIAEFLCDATWTKQAGHGIATPEFLRPDRAMSEIGG